MTGKQRAVLWIGLIIVALNLASKWSDIRGIIFGTSSGSGSGGGNVIPTVPILPIFLSQTTPTTPTPSSAAPRTTTTVT